LKEGELLRYTGWQPLPFSSVDLIKINALPNKVDMLISGIQFVGVNYKHKDVFSDISLISDEYNVKTGTEHNIGLLKGYYIVSDSCFKIYDEEQRLLYIECHYYGTP
jgi:hypothetical protein